jgi:ABC-type bacteriocin/lantibiotic exporter with double-glycine peptidase domain
MKVNCSKIKFSYDQGSLIKDLSFELKSNEHIWIEVQIGSGKSSLLKLLAALLGPQIGQIQIGETAIDQIN